MSRPISATHNVHESFKWMYILLFCMGCLGFQPRGRELRVTRAGTLYTKVIRIVLVFVFLGGFILKLRDEESALAMIWRLSPVLKFLLVMECVNSTITYLQVTITMNRQKQAHIRLAENIMQLDQHIASEFPNLLWNYNRSICKNTFSIIGMICFYFAVSLIYIINVANCNCDWLNTLLIGISYTCITAAPGIVTFLHIGQMDLLRIRLRVIHKMVEEQMAPFHQHPLKPQVNFRVSRLAVYCRNYTELVLKINTIFGYVCASAIFYDFCLLTTMVFLVCVRISDPKSPAKEFIFIPLFMTPRAYKVFKISWAGYLLEKEKRRCTHAIFARNGWSQESSQAFLQWKIHNQYAVTVGNFIRCNLNIAFMVVNAIGNYVIILLQLQTQQNSITEALRNHNKYMSNDERDATNIKEMSKDTFNF